MWKRTSTLLAHSEITFFWTIPDTSPIGTYRIFHRGHAQSLLSGGVSYEGVSREFNIS